MSWDDESWAAFTALLRRGFASRDEFTAADERVYRLLLDGVEPPAATRALQELVLTGQALLPKPGEIVARARADRSVPTFEEAFRLIFGPGGVLRARPTVRRWADETERRRLFRDAAFARAAAMHPLIGSFVERQGIDRLREMPVDDTDPDKQRGVWARKELREAWDRHLEATDAREVTAIASGDRRAGLRRLDPLTAIGAHRDPDVAQLTHDPDAVPEITEEAVA